MTFGEKGDMRDRSRRLIDIIDIDEMMLIISKYFHFAICDINIKTRSCLDIVSIKLVQRAIDTLLREMNDSVT